jgi:hypothetical protein
MVQPNLDKAKAVIEAAALIKQHSMAGTAVFRRDLDRCRKAIQASHELPKLLRQRQRDGMARVWEDAGPAPVAVSAFDADILRSVEPLECRPAPDLPAATTLADDTRAKQAR